MRPRWTAAIWILGSGLGACTPEPGKRASPAGAVDSAAGDSAEPGGSGDSGGALAGELEWVGDDHDLGVVSVDCVVEETRTLTNTGTAPLTVDAVTITGAGFSVLPEAEPPVTLAPGDTLALRVSAAVSTPGDAVGRLTVAWDAGSVLEAREAITVDDDAVCVALDGGGAELSETWTTDVRSSDILLVLDTSCSMSAVLDGVAMSFPTLATTLRAEMPDASFGIATFEDYVHVEGVEELGAAPDLPFHLLLGQTLDPDAVAEALARVELRNGADWPEAHLEAMVQALTGRGFDQGCDGYDALTDVLPFVASADDPFGGTAGQLDTGVALGTGGGTGRRADTLPIVVLATDAYWRDPDVGDHVPEGCADPVGHAEAEAVFQAEGAFFAAYVHRTTGDGGELDTAVRKLAAATDSVRDLDGDGTSDPAAVEWERDVDAGVELAAQIQGLVAELPVSELRVEVEVPPDSGLTASASVDAMGATTTGDPVEVSLSISGTASSSVLLEVRLIGVLDGHTRILGRRTYMVEASAP